MKRVRRSAGVDKTRNLALIAVFAILNGVCAWITVPGAVPLTMQSFAVYLTYLMLGAGRGMASVGSYLLLGVLGLPVFSGGTAGIGILIGKSGGYMLGWLVMGLLLWCAERLGEKGGRLKIFALLLGTAVSYALGAAWFLTVYTEPAALDVSRVIVMCVLPFLLPDMLKLFLAHRVSLRLKRAMTFKGAK